MRPTKEGKKFLLATALIAVAALNTGNNLIYLILSMMLSILTISALLLKLNLRGLSLNISLTQPVFAKETAALKISITNRKRLLPSYSLRIHLPSAMNGEGYMPYVSASSTIDTDVRVLFKKRGIYSSGDFAVESSFPFIFFTKRLEVYVETDIIVYPEIKEVQRIPGLYSGDEYEPATRPGPGEEMLFIREFRYGDDMKKINWRATAKADKLMVKEFALNVPRMFTMILDNINPKNEDAFEKAISLVASAAHRFIKEGFFTRLITCKEQLPFGNTEEHLFEMLYVLAVAEEHDIWQCPMAEEINGISLLVLKSEDSALKGLASRCDMVIYAATL